MSCTIWLHAWGTPPRAALADSHCPLDTVSRARQPCKPHTCDPLDSPGAGPVGLKALANKYSPWRRSACQTVTATVPTCSFPRQRHGKASRWAGRYSLQRRTVSPILSGSPSSKPTGNCKTTSHVVSPGPIFLETRHLWKGLSHRFWKAVVRNLFSQLGTPEGQGSPTGSLGSVTECQGSWGMQFAKAPGLKITVLKDQ